MAEKLEIQVDTDRAQRSLEGLGKAAEALVQQLSSLGKSNGLDALLQQLNSIKGANLGTTAGDIGKIGAAVQALPTAQLAAFANQLSGLGSTSAANAANGLRQVAAAAQGLAGSASGAQALNASLGQTAQAATNAALNANALASSIRQANGAMLGLSAASSALIGFFAQANGSMSQMVGLFQQATGASQGMATALLAMAGVRVFAEIGQAIGALITPIMNSTQQLNTFKVALDATAGAGQGLKSLNDLAGIANRTGGSMQVLANHFKQFKISADAAGLSAQQTNKIFEGFQTAFTVLGVSAQNSENAFRAITQMMSKGKVQAEELRGQLGEHLPNAVGIFARAMGVSSAALDGMLQNGQVLAKDVLPKVADLLLKDYTSGLAQALRTLPAQINIFSSALFQLQGAFGNGMFLGFLQGFANGLQILNGALNSEGLRTFVAVIGDAIGVFTNFASVLGGSFLAGFLAIPRAIGELINAGAAVLNWVKEAVGGFGMLGTIFTTIGAGINAVVAVFGSLTGVFASVVAAALAFNAAAALGGTIMTAWATASSVAARAQAALATAALGSATATAAQGVAAAGATAATTALTVAQARAALTATAMTHAWTVLTLGFSAASAAMAATGASMLSLTAISAGVTAALGAIRAALIALAASNPILLALTAAAAAGLAIWTAWPAIMSAFASTTQAAANGAQVLTSALRDNEATARNNAVALTQLGEKHTSFESQVARSKEKMSEFDRAIQQNDHALKANELSMRDNTRFQQDFVSGLQQQQEALREQVTRLNSQSAALREQGNAYRHSSEGAGAYRQELQSGAQSMDGFQHRARLLNEEIKSIDSTIRSSNSNMADAKRRNDEYRDSLAAQKDKMAELKQEFERYGVLLNDTTRGYVEMFKQTGAVDKAAAQYAITLERLTMSQKERNTLADEEISRLEKQAQAQIKAAEALAAGLTTRDAELKAMGLSAAEIQKLNKEYTELMEAQKKGAQTTFEEIAAIKTVQMARTEGITLIEASKRVTQELTEKYGTQLSAADLLSAAQKQLAKETGVAAETGQKASESWGAINKAIDDGVKNTLEFLGNMAKSTIEFIKTGVAALGAAVAWTGLSVVIAAVNLASAGLPEKMSQIAQALNDMVAPMGTITGNMTQLNTALPIMQTAFTTLAPVLPVVATSFTQIGTAFDQMAPSLPLIGPAFTEMVTPIQSMAEPLKVVADSMVRMQPAMPVVADSFDKFAKAADAGAKPLESIVASVQKLVDTEPKLREFADTAGRVVEKFEELRVAAVKAEPEVAKFATTANNVAVGFDKATNNTNNFITTLGNLLPRIDAVIEKMNKLKEAAEAALKAAQAAASAGGGGGDAESGRYGGFSGGLPERTSVSAGAFSSAPHLARGTANTNRLVSNAVGGRGIPSILHPNEAVVPLPHGRSIPVQFKGGNTNGASDGNSGAKSLASAMGTLGDKIAQQSVNGDSGGEDRGNFATGSKTRPGVDTSRGLFEPRTRNVGNSSPGEVAADRMDTIAQRTRPTGNDLKSRDATAASNSDFPAKTGNLTINMTVQTPNADSFRRSQDQVQAETFSAMKRAFNRNT